VISFDLVNYSAQLSLDVFFITVLSHVYLVCFKCCSSFLCSPCWTRVNGLPSRKRLNGL